MQKVLLTQDSRNKKNSLKKILIGNRIPKDYFITKGKGESDITIHAGSYHLALKNAGIEMCNIITYSSIMPKIANEIERPKELTHGEVMESIMAVAHSKKGQRATVGIIYGWLYNKKTGERFGGLVCEHNGNYDLKEVKTRLKSSINELYFNGFSEDYDLKDINIVCDSFIPKKEHGTVLVSICFVNYLYPVISLTNPDE
jgi:arginine decarboxylase